MLDYYGSITFCKDEALDSLKNYLLNQKYREEYSLKLLSEIDGDVPQEMSVSGWWVFHHKELIEKLNELIQRDVDEALTRLKTATVFYQENTLMTDDDIIQKIAECSS